MVTGLIKTILFVNNANLESKQEDVILIRREGERPTEFTYEKITLNKRDNKNIVSNELLTTNQYISLIEKNFMDGNNNKAYYCEEKKQG